MGLYCANARTHSSAFRPLNLKHLILACATYFASNRLAGTLAYKYIPPNTEHPSRCAAAIISVVYRTPLEPSCWSIPRFSRAGTALHEMSRLESVVPAVGDEVILLPNPKV